MTRGEGRGWLLCLGAPLVWFAHFSGLYGIASFGRASGLNAASLEVIGWTLTILACLAVALLWRRTASMAALARSPAEGVRSVATGLAGLSLAAILFQGLVLSIVPS